MDEKKIYVYIFYIFHNNITFDVSNFYYTIDNNLNTVYFFLVHSLTFLYPQLEDLTNNALFRHN